MTVPAMVTLICSYYALTLGMLLLSPKTIRHAYIPGIIYALVEEGENYHDFKEALNDEVTKRVLKGFERIYYRENPEHERVKIPFTPDLALRAWDLLQEDRIGSSLCYIEKLRVFTAICVGIAFLLRRSEHIVFDSEATARPLLRDDVIFHDKYGFIIPYEEVGLTRTAVKVTLFIEFSKTDSSGKGRINSHIRQPDSIPFCIVRILENWIRLTRDKWGARKKDLLYDIPPAHSDLVDQHLDVEVLNKILTETTNITVDDPEVKVRVTSHSLRYGGATAMAAAGFPQYVIALYGGWAEDSTTLKRYIGIASATVHQVSQGMGEMSMTSTAKTFIDFKVIVGKNKAKKTRGKHK